MQLLWFISVNVNVPDHHGKDCTSPILVSDESQQEEKKIAHSVSFWECSLEWPQYQVLVIMKEMYVQNNTD